MLRITFCQKIIIDFEKMTYGHKTTLSCCDARSSVALQASCGHLCRNATICNPE